MRAFAAALAVLLLVAICSLAEASLRDSGIDAPSQKQGNIPTFCCFAYISRHLPHSMIRSAYMTSSDCSLPAVVLVTRKGKRVCANPKALWVQKYLEQLELPEY
ncbi:CCL5 protein, partial [Pomatostomus ruficeps]|nr:CCL5 protein [Pomatostomus ruficeps]